MMIVCDMCKKNEAFADFSLPAIVEHTFCGGHSLKTLEKKSVVLCRDCQILVANFVNSDIPKRDLSDSDWYLIVEALETLRGSREDVIKRAGTDSDLVSLDRECISRIDALLEKI